MYNVFNSLHKSDAVQAVEAIYNFQAMVCSNLSLILAPNESDSKHFTVKPVYFMRRLRTALLLGC